MNFASWEMSLCLGAAEAPSLQGLQCDFQVWVWPRVGAADFREMIA